MDFSLNFPFLGIVLQVALIDLLLSGDNAVVIALACRSLPPLLLRKAMLLGTGAAVLLRVFLTSLVGVLLALPGLKLLGAVALTVIAIKLMIDEDDDQDEATSSETSDFMGAVVLILLADLVMSLDNVVALSAVAQGNIGVLAFGLLLSVPLLMFGSRLIGKLLKSWPELISAGGALLGWIAGDIAVADPLIADWIQSQAPALSVVVPILGTVFVLAQSRTIEDERPKDRIRLKHSRQAPPPPVASYPPARQEKKDAAKWGDMLRTLTPKNRSPLPAPAPLRQHRAPEIDEAAAANALILLVEDNLFDLAEVANSLIWLGFAVETATDGEEAWARLQSHRHGLVITDCYMPRLDGFGLTSRLRSSDDPVLAALPVVAMVAHYNTADGMGYRQGLVGMNDCVGKPPSLGQLEKAVITWLPAAEALRRPIVEEEA
ncbi:MAG TPA: YjbE family putative metal transport protein [Candidatus Sulfotelmatobacter sp.]|jgi:YjbE family integral membrane protein|nr:YjbE family putative metal transport protein [Candidatus Sulfotelmatobacter sp.]